MPVHLPEDLAWSHDPSLGEEERWRAFKAWEAAQRRKFNASARGREEFDAWQKSVPGQVLGAVRHLSRQKVYRIS